MHVLHVIDGVGVGGGAEESLVAMLPLLRERGIDGSVICLYSRNGHEEGLRAQGFDVTVLNSKGPWGAVLPLRREIRRRNPDLVHASLIDATFATRLASIGLHTPQINSLVNTTYDPMRAHAVGIPAWKLNLLRIIDRETSRGVDRFHVLTEAVADEARKDLHIPDRKLTLVPRGRDRATLGRRSAERRARVRAGLGIDFTTPVILNVGRQAPQKAKLDLVHAMPSVVSVVPDALLLIAGREGSSTEELSQAIAGSPVREHIRVLGHRSDVPDLLAAADLFVLPSLFEGLGGSLIEAMAMECPIVGSDAPAIAEVLGWGQYGRVVPRGDVAGLGTAMAGLLNDPAERARYAAAGLQRFNEQFELRTVVDAMAAMYEDVTSQHRPPLHPRLRGRS